MGICPCGYWWADLDEDGTPISAEYCHYDGPDAWAPCEQEEQYDEVWTEEDEEYEYERWLDEQARQAELEAEEYHEEYGAPYDYQEF